MDGSKKLTRWLRRVEAGFEATEEPKLEAFLHARAPGWVEMLKGVTVAVIRAQRHPETDPAEWLNWANMVAEKLVHSLGPVAVAFLIEQDVLPAATADGGGRAFTWKEIIEWVRAREDRGDPLGKDLSRQADKHPAGGNRPDVQVAWAVLNAINKGDTALAGHVGEYLDNRSASPMEGIMPSVLEAWRNVMAYEAAQAVATWRRVAFGAYRSSLTY